MRFDITPGQILGFLPLSADGSVVCVEQDGSVPNTTESKVWKFATIYTPRDFSHPVSGIREFGYYKTIGGDYIFYMRALDRVTEELDVEVAELLNLPTAFDGGHSLWSTVKLNLNNFVNNNPNGPGSSSINNNYISRVDWNQFINVYNCNQPISSLPGFDMDCQN